MFRRSLKNLLNLLLGMTWLAQSFLSPHPVAALPLRDSSAQIFPCDGMPLSFSGNTQGWTADDYSRARGKLDFNSRLSLQSPEGGNSLPLRLDLAGKGENDRSAQFHVDLVRTPPGCAPAFSFDPNDWWEEGSLLSIWVWAPRGMRGNPDHPNGLHLYMQDDSQEGFGSYGTWQTFQEETWFEVTLRLNNENPVCGEKKASFEYSHLRKFGLNVSLNQDNADPIHGTIYISPMRIKSKDLALPASDHSYTFDAMTKERPQWNIVTDPLWQAQAFTKVNTHDGARVVDVDFHVDQENDPRRKGVLNLVYAPDLNLGDAYHTDDFFSLDIRFDPPPDLRVENCPFSLKLWAFDSGKKVQFDSINQDVGSDQWTRVAFRLGNLLPSTEGANSEDRLDTSRIGKIGFQLFAGTSLYEYQGQIWIDNIAVGNATYDEPPPTFPFVERAGPQFTVDGQRFRFVGANAEYLPYKPDQVVTDVLDRAESLGIHVIRTWGFGEGCEDYYLPNCEDVSPYFQPKPGEYNQAAFEHFDRIVYEAGKRNIRLIIPLVNNWYEHGGIPRYVCWLKYRDHPLDCNVRLMSEEDHDLFYKDSTIRDWYQEYVKHFITRKNTITGTIYANDPTIMAWELINEPRSKSDPSGQYLHQWIVDMSTYLAGLTPAPVQLIGTGEEGWYILPKETADKSDNWQVFHKNYWHYGVNWAEASCIDSFGSNGTDFLSDNSTDPRTVKWQTMVSNESSSPVEAEKRTGVPKIGFTGIHLYLSPAETGLSYALYCYYYGLDSLCSSLYDTTNERTTRNPEFQEPVHQAKEWIKQHVETAHEVLQEPFLLEEFNFPVPSKTPLGVEATFSSDTFQVTPDERARLFRQYLDFSYDMDVDGVLFWNLGYDGFLQQSWSEIDALKQWEAKSGGSVDSDTSDGIRFSYSANEKSSMELSEPKVDWLRAEGNQVMVDLFNDGDAQDVVIDVQLSGDVVPRSKTIQIQPGANKILLGELFTPVQKLQSKTTCPLPKEEPPKVKKITITFPSPKSSSSALFNFTTIFNNKYVIFPGDPVEDVIRTATSRWEDGFKPTPPKVVINQNITCNDRINSELIKRPLPIYFKFNGSIEHADGYYYRYSVASPGGQYELNFGSSGLVHRNHIAVTANALGKYEVKIAPEGESFDSPSAASCNFSVMNDRPVLTIESIRFNGQEFQPHEILTVDRDILGSKREIEIHISGIDDVSSELEVVCRLLKVNREIDSSMLSCPASLNATTQEGAQGLPVSITGMLSPGSYQLQLWLQDEESEVSGISSINIVIPDPRYFYVFFALGLIVAGTVYFGRSRIRSTFSGFFKRKVDRGN